MNSRVPAILFTALLFVRVIYCQTGALRGVVSDESGAIVQGAQVTARAAGPVRSTTSRKDGTWSISGLPFGVYELDASAPQLRLPGPVKVELRSASLTVALQLKIVATVQQVSVRDTAGDTVTTDPSSNANAIVIKGDDLQALADDPEDLTADLQALAGPAAGPGGGEIFIDGLSR